MMYLVDEMATKALDSVQTKQQRVTSSQKAVETKQLTLRLAGEQFGIPKTSLSIGTYVASTLNLEQVDLTSVQCLMKKTERHRMVLPITTLVWLWRSNMHTYAEF